MPMKTCTRCGQTKSLCHFPPVRRSEPEKLQSWCRACFSLANKRNYWQNPEAARSRVVQNSARRRAESHRRAIEYLVGHPCVDCGERDILVLQFDHLRNKSFDLSIMISTGMSWARIEAEIAKCVVRCANCHARKTARDRGYRKRGATPMSSNQVAPVLPLGLQLELGTAGIRTCRVCGIRKPDTEFHFRSREKATRHHICRSCRSDYHRAWWTENRERQMPNIRRNRETRGRRIEQRIWDYLFTHACVDCGESDLVVLHFDHLRDKVAEISAIWRQRHSWSAVEAEIRKCEVRCANCHARKTAREIGNYRTKAS